LSVPPFNVISTQRLNYDDAPGTSATESVESANPGWTITGGLTASPNVNAWQRRALSPTEHVWWGPDNNGQVNDQRPEAIDEQVLISPTMHVGSGPLVISFRHRFSFEPVGWDGGVIEISTNDGATWTDIGTAAYNGSTNKFTDTPIGRNRPAFVNRMAGWPNFANVTLNLGATYTHQDVKIRFRIGSDEEIGAPGWDIDDVAISGITNTPFRALVAQTACPH